MTDKQTFNIGLILVALGTLVFFGNVGLFNGMPGIVGSLVLGTGGFLFSRIYFQNKRQVWALPIGFGFFGLAAAAITGDLAGAYFLGITGAGFALTYLQNKRHWWAIIPAGVLATLAVIVGIEEQIPFLGDIAGTVLFLGFAATFAALYFLPEGGKRWAIFPAIGAVIIAILSSSFTGGWVLPLALIAGGAYLLRRNKGFVFSFGAEQQVEEVERSQDETVEQNVQAEVVAEEPSKEDVAAHDEEIKS